jgi:hypothetical protein
MTDPLPAAVKDLLSEHVTGFEHLEVALLLHAHPGQFWQVTDICTRAHVPRELALRTLSELDASGLIARDGAGADAFCFAPRDEALARAMDELAVSHRDFRLAVISHLSLNAINRIRSGSIRAFSDAFVLSRGGKRG